jgi:ATP-dependent Clp protease ATP-binding subunit ClpA
MTSNVGAADIARTRVGFARISQKGDDEVAFKNTFSPEFRNRLDARIRFDALSPEVMGHIVDKVFKEMSTQLAERNVIVELSDDARAYFADKGYDADNGARPLARLIQDEVKRPLGDEILFGKLEHGGRVRVAVEGNEVRFQIEGENVTEH